MKKKKTKRIRLAALFLTMILLINGLFPILQQVQAAVKLNRASATLWVGETLQLKVQNTDKKTKWSSDSDSVATVSSKGKVVAKKNW